MNNVGKAKTEKTTYWRCQTGSSEEKKKREKNNEKKVWEMFYDEGIIAIGFSKINIGDLSCLSVEDMKNATKEHTQTCCAFKYIANEIKIGDIVYAIKGKSEILGKGTVISDYFYDNSRSNYCHTRKVKWEEKEKLSYAHNVRLTLTKIKECDKQLYDDLYK